MAQVSVTRLRLRSNWFLLPFAFYSVRSHTQATRADGCFAAVVRRHKGAFWTLSVWRDAAATKAFMLAGVHRAAMPNLRHWCDEASRAHWSQDGDGLPRWSEAEARLKAEGQTSFVDHPSPAHAAGLTLGSEK
jgi:hypothetical protein